MSIATRFTDPVAVETWDACFRWREGDALRDVTIDDTWWRVANAVATSPWAGRYVEAFCRWRLLPDERLLRCAGTPVANETIPNETIDAPAAVLNAGAFVDAWGGMQARFNRKAFMDTATLAVRLLDDALLSTRLFTADAGLRIGLIGFGDALAKLGVPYDSAAARELARALATDLAEGCLRGAVMLAEERGARVAEARSPGLVRRLQSRGMPAALVEAALCHGVRHVQITCIEPHPLLARLANGGSDALDPAAMPAHAAVPAALLEAERGIGAEMQPWIDAPIGGAAAPLAALVQAVARGAGDSGPRLPA